MGFLRRRSASAKNFDLNVVREYIKEQRLEVEVNRESISPPLWWCALGIALAVLVIPLLVVSVPPLADYPNHLTRSYVFAFRGSHPLLDAMFAPHWSLIPNLATDLLLPPLMRVMPPLVAGKLIVALSALLPMTGAIALSRASFGLRSIWQIGAAIAAYNGLFLFGFINFHIAIGFAFWAAAFWVYLTPRHSRITVVIGAIAALVCFIFHLFGYIVFAVLIGSSELGRLLTHAGRMRAYIEAASRLALALVLPAVLYVTSTFAHTDGIVWSHSPLRWSEILLPVLGYSPWLSRGITAIVIATVIMWLVRGQLRVMAASWIIVTAFLVLYMVLPFAAKGGYWISSRIPVILGFLCFSLAVPRRVSRNDGIIITSVLASLFFVRMALVTQAWSGSGQDLADVRALLTKVPPGSRILPVAVDPFGNQGDANHPGRAITRGVPQAWWHYLAFSVIDRDAYWPDMFAYPGQQPMVNKPPYDQLGDGLGRAPTDYRLLAPDYMGSRPADLGSHIENWNSKFDYVMLLNADIPHQIPPSLDIRLQLVDQRNFAALFKVMRSVDARTSHVQPATLPREP